MKRSLQFLFAAAALCLACASLAQSAGDFTTSAEYDAWKGQFIGQNAIPAHPAPVQDASRDGEEPCPCWIMPDDTYTTINNATEWDASGYGNGDDGSYGPVSLPFSFQLYGESYDQVFININGSVSFGTYVSTYSSSSFPLSGPSLVAPFWADVDLRVGAPDQNLVQYKVTPQALYVNWTNVGYFNQETDKLNGFQLVISDGTAPDVGIGNNVAFCYGQMEWTTGAASGGVEGLGGIPATVGANRGNGLDYIQFGRFDHPGDDYNGPFGTASGIDWLTGKHFVFNTFNEDIPPIFTSTGCDTLEIELGSSFEYQMLVLAGGAWQTVAASSQCPGIAAYTETQEAFGNYLKIVSTIAPATDEVGLHAITYAAQVEGQPGLASSYTVYLKVGTTTGIAPAATATGYALVPNPATDRTVLTWPAGQAPARVDVVAVSGAVVWSRDIPAGAGHLEIALSALPAGVYSVRIPGNGGTRVLRLVRGVE